MNTQTICNDIYEGKVFKTPEEVEKAKQDKLREELSEEAIHAKWIDLPKTQEMFRQIDMRLLVCHEQLCEKGRTSDVNPVECQVALASYVALQDLIFDIKNNFKS